MVHQYGADSIEQNFKVNIFPSSSLVALQKQENPIYRYIYIYIYIYKNTKLYIIHIYIYTQIYLSVQIHIHTYKSTAKYLIYPLRSFNLKR